MATRHIEAEPGDIAASILLPGDPLRARHIAEQFLDDAVQVTGVRNMLGFTGTYRGEPVSVMGTGMGIPSAAIYINELIEHYGVERLVRVGTSGAIDSDIGLKDIVLAIGACTDSGTNRTMYGGYDFAATADFDLLAATVDAAAAANIHVRVGNVHSGELLYRPDRSLYAVMREMGVLAADMEAAGLYALAARFGVQALTVLMVSDHIESGDALSAEEREQSFGDMVSLALEGLRREKDQKHHLSRRRVR